MERRAQRPRHEGAGTSPVRSQPAECSRTGVHVHTDPDIEYCRIAVQEPSKDVHNDRGNEGAGTSPDRSQPAGCSRHAVHVHTDPDIDYCRITVREQRNHMINDRGMRMLARALSGHSLQSAPLAVHQPAWYLPAATRRAVTTAPPTVGWPAAAATLGVWRVGTLRVSSLSQLPRPTRPWCARGALPGLSGCREASG